MIAKIFYGRCRCLRPRSRGVGTSCEFSVCMDFGIYDAAAFFFIVFTLFVRRFYAVVGGFYAILGRLGRGG